MGSKGCNEVYGRIANDQGLKDELNGSNGAKAKQQLAAAIEHSFENFLRWQQEELKSKLQEMGFPTSKEVQKGKTNGDTPRKSGWSDRNGDTPRKSGWSESDTTRKSGWSRSGDTPRKNTGWGARGSREVKKTDEKTGWKDKLKNKFSRGGRGSGSTGANKIQVQWRPPTKKAESPSKLKAAAAMSASAVPPSAGPAGRGRGTSLP